MTGTSDEYRDEFPSEGIHRGSRFRFERAAAISSIDVDSLDAVTTEPLETIVLECPTEVACRFILDESLYRNSYLFKPTGTRFGLEVGPPFWRSDEPERLAALKQNATFQEITSRLEHSPGFGALVVCRAGDPRLPLESLARQFEGGHDLIMLQRRGTTRTQNEISRDLDQLAALRDLLKGNVVPHELPRAEGANVLRTVAMAALRMVILFVAAIATMALIYYVCWNYM